jgi:hypothetical protein
MIGGKLALLSLLPRDKRFEEAPMATLTGVLRISGNDSRVNGTLLARCGDGSPFSAATGFLGDNNLIDGDEVTVTGEPGAVGNVACFCMEDATRN